jgi:hypothetical protein
VGRLRYEAFYISLPFLPAGKSQKYPKHQIQLV